MAKSIYGFSESLPTDPITGCLEIGDYQCKQTFYLKQQNEILQQQEINSKLQQENTELKSQFQNLQKEVEGLKTQQTSQVTQPQNNLLASIQSASVPSILIVTVFAVAIGIFIGKKFFSKKI